LQVHGSVALSNSRQGFALSCKGQTDWLFFLS
jgi:hypothetical protein